MMGGFNPISTVLSTVSTVAGLGGQAMRISNGYNDASQAYKNAQADYAQQEREIAQKEKSEREKLQIDADEAARKRRDSLKRTTAQQKAAFGGQGIDSNDGSGQAVLLGLFQQSDDEKKYRDRLDNLRNQSLTQNVDNARRRNLLQLNESYTSAQSGYRRQNANFADSIPSFNNELEDLT